MSFYAPENFSDPGQLAYERSNRILQPLWEYMKDGREDVLRSALFPPVLAVVCYFVCVIPFTLIDIFGKNSPSVQKYKIQKQKTVTWGMMWSAGVLLFWNNMIYIIPIALVQAVWIPPTPLPSLAPPLFEFIWHQIAWFFLFDAYYWAFHALHHKVRFLYRWVHSVHHQYHSPFALMTQYLHPFELFSVGLGVTVIPWAFQPHILTYWSWFILSTYVSVEVHCGYDLPFTLDKLLTIYGGASKHDLHHLRPLSNFEPWMCYLDKIVGWEFTWGDLEKAKLKKLNVGLQHPDDELLRKKFN